MQKPPKRLWQIVPHPIQMQAALLVAWREGVLTRSQVVDGAQVVNGPNPKK